MPSRVLALCLASACACARPTSMRGLRLVADVRYAPGNEGRDVLAGVSLVATPHPPPVPSPDEGHPLPLPPSRLSRCRSMHDLCHFERASIERALAAFGAISP